MSVDGKIALPTRVETKISNEQDLRRVHNLRNECDAILVGIGTILTDNPKLVVKKKYIAGKLRNPTRIVIDSKCRVPRNARVLDGTVPTIVICTRGYARKLRGAEVIECSENKGKVDLRALLSILKRRGFQRLLVEGGSEIIWSFLSSKLADELRVFVSNLVIGGRTTPTLAGGEGSRKLSDVIRLKLENVEMLGEGVLLQYKVLK
jgi:2,5-diamino-6-(ribosylamino)-4(3H)-pyrimidinone 5'-phosphate reductase